MYRNLTLVTLSALLLVAAPVVADDVLSLEAWPEWVRESMNAETRRLKFRNVASPDKSIRSRLPGKTAAPEAMEEGWYFVSDIKAGSPVECYVYTSARDLATLTKLIAEANIEAVASNVGVAGNQHIYHTSAGVTAGRPSLALEWIYTVQSDAQTVVGFTKVRAAAKGETAYVCTHNYIGYRDTLNKIFSEFVISTEIADATPTPYYEEIARLNMGHNGAGVAYASYTVDEDGDIRMYSAEASLVPVDAATLMTGDSYTITYSQPDGELLSAHTIAVENDEITTNMTLDRNEDGTWISSGTMQGKELSFEIDGTLQPSSELQQIAMAKNLFAGDDTSTSTLVWLAGLDPTRFLDATMTRDDADVERQATMTLGPMSYSGQFDEDGNLHHADIRIGPVAINIERIWSQGSLQR